MSPEEFILEMMRTLKKGGVLSISLPADPGLGWRIGRLFVGFFKAKNNYNINFEKYEYMNATEHVNSISELEEAFKRAKKSDVTYVISIKTHAYQWLEGSSFWDSPTLEIPTTEENKEAIKLYKEGKSKQRQGV